MLSEFLYSETAKAKGIDNSPNEIHLKTIKHTAVYLLEPLRGLINRKYRSYKGFPVRYVSIKITSGYRSAKLNKAIPNSSKTSEHCIGAAVDIEARIHVANGSIFVLPYTELYKDIKGWVKSGELSVNQCIQEQSGNAYWVHVSHSPSGRTLDKKEFLIYKNRKYYKDKN